MFISAIKRATQLEVARKQVIIHELTNDRALISSRDLFVLARIIHKRLVKERVAVVDDIVLDDSGRYCVWFTKQLPWNVTRLHRGIRAKHRSHEWMLNGLKYRSYHRSPCQHNRRRSMYTRKSQLAYLLMCFRVDRYPVPMFLRLDFNSRKGL